MVTHLVGDYILLTDLGALIPCIYGKACFRLPNQIVQTTEHQNQSKQNKATDLMCRPVQGAGLLLDRGANPNTSDESGNTPLHDAALRGNQDMVRLLMDKGANPNVVGEKGKTPLHLAAKNGHMDVVQLLIDGGADINKTDDEGRTPLAEAGYTRLIKILLDAGADSTLCYTFGRQETSSGHCKESA